MGKFPCGIFFFNYRFHFGHSQRTDGNQQHNEDNTYYQKITHTTNCYHTLTQSNTTKHNTHFQQRYMPLHSKWHDSCMLRTCSANKEWTKVHALWPLEQVRAVRIERADWTSDHCHCYWERRGERKRREREEERRKRKREGTRER